MRERDRNKKRRIERQEEATARQATYDAMTTVQRFNRPGIGAREYDRLLAILNADTNAAIGAVRLA
jgi:hypothetical protein